MPHNLYNASTMQFCIIGRTLLNKCGDKKKHRAKLARNPKTCFLILWLVIRHWRIMLVILEYNAVIMPLIMLILGYNASFLGKKQTLNMHEMQCTCVLLQGEYSDM